MPFNGFSQMILIKMKYFLPLRNDSLMRMILRGK